MRQELEHNLQLAHSIKAYVKHRVVCSNDLIRRSILPDFLVHLIPFYRLIFGNELINSYLTFITLTKLIRVSIFNESKKMLMNAQISTSSLAVTTFGVGECQEIATLCYNKLMTDSHSNVQFICISAPQTPDRDLPYMHCFVLIGNDELQLKSPCDISELNDLPDHIVALDAYLDYVGPANNYLRDQQTYLEQYQYNHIAVIDRPTSLHYENLPFIKENIEILKERAACQHFYRHFLTLSLSCFSIAELLPCHETALVQFLNDSSGLRFSWGHLDYQVSAYTDVSSEENFAIAKSIQKRLQAGTFYQDSSQRLFVLHGINMQRDLADKIETNYRIVP